MNAELSERRVNSRRTGYHPFQLIVLALSVLPLTVFVVATIGIWRWGGQAMSLGWAGAWGNSSVVVSVTNGGPADGKLRPGDRIVAMDGDRRVDVLGTFWKERSLRPGRPYTLDVLRSGAIHRVSLEWSLVDSDRSWPLASQALVGFLWTALGLFIGFARPSDVAARLWALAALSVGLAFARMPLNVLVPQLGSWSVVLHGAAEPLAPLAVALAYHSMYRFPPGVPSGRFWSAGLVAVYVSAAVRCWGSLPAFARYALSPDMAVAVARIVGSVPGTSRLNQISEMATLVLAGAVALRNFRLVESADERRRVRWIVVAMAVAVIPESLIAVHGEPSRWDYLGDLFTGIVPIAFAYAIVQHRVFDILVVVRIGIQYLLARSALHFAIGAPIAAMIYLVASNPNLMIRELALNYPAYPALAVTAAGALAFRRRLATGIDRRFFREAYDRERLLESLLDDIDTVYAGEDGVRRFAERLDTALHPATLRIWFHHHDRERMRLSLSRSSVAAIDDQEWLLPLHVVHELESNTPLYIRECDRRGIEPEAQVRLERLGIELLVPMVGHDGRLRGLLGLGPKRADEPYTPADLHLLQRIARELATVNEHIELRTRIDHEERVRQEVLGHLSHAAVSLLKECPACGACYEAEQEHCTIDGRELTLSLPVERTIHDRYRLDRLVGRGGMGAVYEAFDLSLQRVVAVKIMVGRNFGNEEAIRRFDREARAVGRLNHPNIIAVFDYGRLAGDGAYLVMERLEGRTLRAELTVRRAFPPREAAVWVAGILDGVEAAHAHGVIHRDLKPENVLVPTADSARIKVLDFGLARLGTSAGDVTLSMSMPGVVVGTFAYMAPEQMLGQAVDQRADIFALGIIVTEILTGQRPFSDDPIRRLRDLEGGPSPAIIRDERARRVVGCCLAPDRNDRYPTVDAARSDLLATVTRCAERGRVAEPHTTEQPTISRIAPL